MKHNNSKQSWSESPVSALLNTNALADYPFEFVLIPQVDRTGEQTQTYLYIGVSAQKNVWMCVRSIPIMHAICLWLPAKQLALPWPHGSLSTLYQREPN